ncbi:hypothetical protein K5X82_14930 [Halosquirtibacter xylanolyticus]|uniref:hypothetical protein n=1 Tax=Halosquirtibacter xylanolyticus TaxID=3374599 RepID=UPI00374A7289|nr:hypothetical protein K5X82_14930 [Prolixibacteraceae bacterium]
MRFIILLMLSTLSFGAYSQAFDPLYESKKKEAESVQSIKREMIGHINKDQLTEASNAYNRLVKNKSANSIMLYSEWIYCTAIFEDTEQFQKIISSRYKKPVFQSEEDLHQFGSSLKSIKKYYNRHFDEIKEHIIHKDSLDDEINNLYVYQFIVTDPKIEDKKQKQYKAMLEAHVDRNPDSKDRYYILWLINEIDDINSIITQGEMKGGIKTHSSNEWNAIGVGMGGFSPNISLFDQGKGFYISFGSIYNNLYLESNLNYTFSNFTRPDHIIGEDGSGFDVSTKTGVTYYNLNIGVGPMISLGKSHIIIMGRLGYSSMRVSNNGKTYSLTSNLNIAPAGRIGLCLYDKKMKSEYDRPFRLYLTGEVGYNKSIIKFHELKVGDDGSYFQVGLNFAFK